MAEVDFAVYGTGLLPTLLAGLLARDHGRRVVRVGRRRSSQRLPRGLDLGLPLSVHPASWRLVRQGESEIAQLMRGIGAAPGLATAEVALVADQPDSAAALDHLAHVALGHGHQLRRVPKGWALRRITQLHAETLGDLLADWLAAAGVATVETGPVSATQTIVADDAALLEHVAEDRRPPDLVVEAMTATLLAAPRGLAAPILLHPDRGVTLLRRPDNTVLALARGAADVEARIASALAGPFPVKRLASTRYRRLVTRDGAPLIGRIKGARLFAIAGLGDAGAFLAPALARFLAGTAVPDEKRWVAAHAPARSRDAVADFAPFLAAAS